MNLLCQTYYEHSLHFVADQIKVIVVVTVMCLDFFPKSFHAVLLLECKELSHCGTDG